MMVRDVMVLVEIRVRKRNGIFLNRFFFMVKYFAEKEKS